MFKFRLRFHWSLFQRVKLTIFQHWFRWWLGTVQVTSHHLNQWWWIYWHIYALLSLIELICISLNREKTGKFFMSPAQQIPPTHRSCWGVYWFHSICPSFHPSIHPSVCPASSVHSVAPIVLFGSISYLYILFSNFSRCVACKVSCKISKFGNFFKSVTLILSCFDLGSGVNH